jgi:hypothetical protein
MDEVPGVTEMIDPSRVTPGLLGLAAFIFLILIVVVIWITMNRSLKTTNKNFEPGNAGLIKPEGESPPQPRA